MKEKVIIFIIGLLIGAIISTGSILVYTLTTNSSNTTSENSRQMPGGTPPEMTNGGTPPSMPTNSSTESSN